MDEERLVLLSILPGSSFDDVAVGFFFFFFLSCFSCFEFFGVLDFTDEEVAAEDENEAFRPPSVLLPLDSKMFGSDPEKFIIPLDDSDFCTMGMATGTRGVVTATVCFCMSP